MSVNKFWWLILRKLSRVLYLQGFYLLVLNMQPCGTCFAEIEWYQQFWPFGNDNYLPENLAGCELAPYFCGKQKRLGKDKLIQELFQKIKVLTSRLEQAEKKISELKAENAELKARLNSNSKNSSNERYNNCLLLWWYGIHSIEFEMQK